MTTYEVRQFHDELELSEDEDVVAANLSMGGLRGNRANLALVQLPEVDEYECGVNGCSRTVDGPDETCWQHPEDG